MRRTKNLEPLFLKLILVFSPLRFFFFVFFFLLLAVSLFIAFRFCGTESGSFSGKQKILRGHFRVLFSSTLLEYKTNCKADRTAKRVILFPNISVRQNPPSSGAAKS